MIPPESAMDQTGEFAGRYQTLRDRLGELWSESTDNHVRWREVREEYLDKYEELVELLPLVTAPL